MHRRFQVIVLILIGLTSLCLIITVVVKVRDAANQMWCSDNLHRIVMASHKYHDDYKCLPPGYIGPSPDRPGIDRAPHVGVLVYLLPYMTKEEKTWEAPYYQVDLKAPTDPPEAARQYQPAADQSWWTLANPQTSVANTSLAKKHFSFLNCPAASDDLPQEGLIVALHAFGKNEFKEGFLQREMIRVADDSSGKTWGTTHYLGITGRFGAGDQFVGVYTNRSKLTLGQVTLNDGCSNTLCFGEACGGFAVSEGESSQRRLTAYSWFCGALPTYYGLPEPPKFPWYAFNGPHRQTVNFAFLDGHICKFKRNGHQEAMGTIDGTPVPWVMDGNSIDPDSKRWKWLQALAGYKDALYLEPLSLTD